jgi:serine/threonine protein kinase
VGDPNYGKFDKIYIKIRNIVFQKITYLRPVDIWSIGVLAYEVLTSKPLFPGESDLDQLYLIINYLGFLVLKINLVWIYCIIFINI